MNSKTFFAGVVLSWSAFTISSAQHSVLMKSGEKMNGEVQSLKDGIITFVFHGNNMTLKVADVSAVYFTDTPTGTISKSDLSMPSGTKGVQFTMNGRKLVRQPKVENLTQDKGTVVVEITINKYGNVVKATPGVEGSNTHNQYLLTKAKQAAESVQFDTSPTMPLEQKGTISIVF